MQLTVHLWNYLWTTCVCARATSFLQTESGTKLCLNDTHAITGTLLFIPVNLYIMDFLSSISKIYVSLSRLYSTIIVHWLFFHNRRISGWLCCSVCNMHAHVRILIRKIEEIHLFPPDLFKIRIFTHKCYAVFPDVSWKSQDSPHWKLATQLGHH